MRRAIFTAFALCLVLLSATGFSDLEYGLSNQITARRGLSGDLLRGGDPSVGWTGDTITVVFSLNPGSDHYLDEADADLAAATDTIQVGVDAPEFAWGFVNADGADSNASFATSATPDATYGRRVYATSGTGDNTLPYWTNAHATSAYSLMYIDWADHLPANCQIVSAEIKHYGDTSYNSVGRDSVIAVLMTNAADSLWYTSRGFNDGAVDFEYLAHATWAYQISALNANEYPATGDDLWGSYLGSRTDYTDWGDVADFTGFATNPTSTGATGPVPAISITNCVQSAVNGGTNNGIVWFYNETAVTAQNKIQYHWEENYAPAEVNPWVVVKYIDRKYTAPYPDSAEFAFVFSTDGCDTASNRKYSDLFAAVGGSYTVSMVRGNAEGGGAVATWADVFSWYEDGMEIASHGMYGNLQTSKFGGGETPQWSMDMVDGTDFAKGMTPLTMSGTAPWDSLRHDMDPQFLFIGAAKAGYDDSLKSDERVGRSFTCYSNSFSPYMLQAAQELGYDAIRGNYAYNVATYPFLGYGEADGANYLRLYAPPEYFPAGTVCDSLKGGLDPNARRDPRNMMGVKSTYSVERIVGNSAATPTESEVKARTRSLIRKIKAQQTGLLAFYSHGEKSLASSHNIDADELGWILEVVVEEGGWIANMGEYARWMQTWSDVMPTPDGYNQDDDFRFRADEAVWHRPHGIDNRWIRGYSDDSDIPPDYPRGLYARYETIDGELVVLLDWTPNTEGDLFGYRVYRGTSSGGPYSTFVQWVFGEAVATDNTASSGSTYYYVVTAVDDEGNESAYSAEFEITPVISSGQPVYFPVVLRGEDVRAIDASGDSLVVTAEVNLNKAASVKMLSWWKGGGDSSWHNTTPTDTTAARFPWQHYTEAMNAQTRGEFVTDWATAIPIPQWSDGTAASQEDSALSLKWNWQNGNTFPDGAILQRQHNYGAWETVMDNIGFGALGDSIFVHYGASGDTLVGVRKGVENYRVKGWTGTSYANRTGEDETWDMLDSPYYNQAVEYFVQAHAQDGSDWAVGAVLSGIYTTPDWSSVDETPPTISFSSVTYDTTGNVVIEVQTTTDEPAIAGFQIAEDYNRSWRPAIGSVLWGSDGTGATVDSTYASTQNDTIATLISTANLDSLYIRAYARDDSANVSDPVEYVTLFTRASVAVDDTIGTGVVGATASSADLVAYGGRITMDAGGGDITSATAYIGNLTNASLSLKAGLYDTSFNLVASGELTESNAYSGWKTVTFTTPYTATGSTDYIVMFFSSTGGAKMFYDTEGAAGTNIGYAEAGIGYSSFPADPMSPEGSYDTRRYSFYVTFE